MEVNRILWTSGCEQKKRGMQFDEVYKKYPTAALDVCGDFNEIINAWEKFGGCRRARGLMDDFKETLAFCELSDLGAYRPHYTWHNGRDSDDFTQKRLDRVVASSDWCEMFQDVRISVEASPTSDHAPLLLLVGKETT